MRRSPPRSESHSFYLLLSCGFSSSFSIWLRRPRQRCFLGQRKYQHSTFICCCACFWLVLLLLLLSALCGFGFFNCTWGASHPLRHHQRTHLEGGKTIIIRLSIIKAGCPLKFFSELLKLYIFSYCLWVDWTRLDSSVFRIRTYICIYMLYTLGCVGVGLLNLLPLISGIAFSVLNGSQNGTGIKFSSRTTGNE